MEEEMEEVFRKKARQMITMMIVNDHDSDDDNDDDRWKQWWSMIITMMIDDPDDFKRSWIGSLKTKITGKQELFWNIRNYSILPTLCCILHCVRLKEILLLTPKLEYQNLFYSTTLCGLGGR